MSDFDLFALLTNERERRLAELASRHGARLGERRARAHLDLGRGRNRRAGQFD